MNSSKTHNTTLLILAGISSLVFLFLVFRNTGLYPTVFADEYTYSKLSRLLPLSESSIPGYVYLKLYSLTNYCGDGFLGCAKLINTSLFVSAIPFIYLSCRRIADSNSSLIVSLLAVTGPINSYTAYFMPESFYFLSFWIFCWHLTGLNSGSKTFGWLSAGTIYGISALIKPHSIFFFPAIFAYICFLFFQNDRLFSRKTCIALASFLLGAVLAKFGLSYVLVGSEGLTIFGPLYGSIASSTASGADRYSLLLKFAFESTKGHLLVITLVYGLPLTLAITVTFNRFFSKTPREVDKSKNICQFERTAALTLFVLLNLVCISALFTASVSGSGPYESPYRLHMRYYNFALPLFYIVAAGALSTTIEINRYSRYFAGAIISICGVYAIWKNLAPYSLSHVDSPEIRGLHINHLYFQVIGGTLIFALALWSVFQRKGLQFYLYLSLPLFVVVSTYHIGLDLNKRLKRDVYDTAGLFTKQYLPNEELSKVVVVGSETPGLLKTLFHIDNASASLEVIQRGADYDLSRLPAGKDWILMVGGQKPLGVSPYQIPMNGFSLVRAPNSILINFKKGTWPGIILRTTGLSKPEYWGTWSQSDRVDFEFTGSLPSKFEIHLTARAFGPNIDSELEASVGKETVKFKLSANDELIVLKFNNPENSRILQVAIPNAASPKSLGLNKDVRKLGIGFVEMKIVSQE